MKGLKNADLSLRLAALQGEERHNALEKEFEELFELLWLPVCRYLSRILNNPAAAEELAQDAMLKLYQARLDGVVVAESRAWLFRAAHNLAIDRLRQDARQSALQLPIPEPPAGAERDLIEAERQRRFQLALRLLSPQENHVVELRAEGLRYREIGEVLGIKIPTVVTLLERAVEKLRTVVR